MSRPNVLLDTCVLINLLASGVCEDILRDMDRQWLICMAVQRESLYLRTNDAKKPLEQVVLEPLIAQKLLRTSDVETTAEAQLYVNYSAVLGDGEAMSVALAISREYILATDDRKARRLFLEAAGPDKLTCTTQILRDWAEQTKLSQKGLTKVLLQVVNRAQFFPAASDPNHQWWRDLCSEGPHE